MNGDGQETDAVRDPLGRSMKADLNEVYAPLGVRLRFETNSPLLLEAAGKAFGRYGSAGGLPQSVIRLLVDPVFSEAAPWPDPVFRGQGALFYICVGRQNVAVADLDRRHAFGFVSPAMARDEDFLRRTFLECLAFTLATHGPGATHTYVHASAVAKGKKGLIFSGPRESGKSTLAYACARRGFKVVTDDVVYLNRGGSSLTAWGRPWRLRLMSDCVDFFPELRSKAGFKDGAQDAIEIELDKLMPDRTQMRCEPAGLFFLERSADPPVCDALKPERAVNLLARDLICDIPEVMQRHRRAWLRLAQRGAYRLRYGGDLDSVIDLLQRFL